MLENIANEPSVERLDSQDFQWPPGVEVVLAVGTQYELQQIARQEILDHTRQIEGGTHAHQQHELGAWLGRYLSELVVWTGARK